MAHPESILTLAYDFLLYLIPQLSKFPRDQKFLLADRMQNLAHDVLDDLIVAYYSSLSPEKVERLRQANLKLERLRFCIRLSHDLKLISNEKYGKLSERVNALGGTLGNWLKNLTNRQK
ncbi:MAG: hypothetical protein DKINENOH_04511 [bacterium]|nr:hypothetical protein [bacterium]